MQKDVRSDSNEILRDWLKAIIRSGRARNVTDIAQKSGLHGSTLTRLMQRDSTQAMRESSICKIERAFGPRPTAILPVGLKFAEPRSEFVSGNIAFSKQLLEIALVDEAAAYGLDTDAIARKAIEDAVKAERIRRWNEENREAIESWNELVEREGLWSDGIRAF